ncbi:hypothetical protein [Derxia lacustris]|uniref:hypothetical protein n=1 Tax=Derxia lacustris TaxID=764842 RepID=UPI00111BF60E|nr:hypothetical protein [Derxia lacustris]
MNKNEYIGQSKTSPQYAVALPCTQEDFSSFIKSLLGKPQTISKGFYGHFELKHTDIANTHQLITQRIAQQNESHLLQFTARLIYDDNSSILLTSLHDFQTYSEVRPLIATQVHLSWQFLVTFRDRTTPEKQDIDISFITKLEGAIKLFSSSDSPVIPLSKFIGGGGATFRIKHTARTWGADIEALLSGHIEHIFHPKNDLQQFCQRHSGKIALLSGCAFFIGSISTCIQQAISLKTEQLKEINNIIATNTQPEKIDHILKMIANGTWQSFYTTATLFALTSGILTIGIMLWVGTTAGRHQQSHILLTKKSEQYKEKCDRQQKINWLSFIGSISFSLITGILGNIIFEKIWH